MKFTVRVFLGDELIPEDKLKDIVINSPVVNRIVDAVIERTYEVSTQRKWVHDSLHVPLFFI